MLELGGGRWEYFSRVESSRVDEKVRRFEPRNLSARCTS